MLRTEEGPQSPSYYNHMSTSNHRPTPTCFWAIANQAELHIIWWQFSHFSHISSKKCALILEITTEKELQKCHWKDDSSVSPRPSPPSHPSRTKPRQRSSDTKRMPVPSEYAHYWAGNHRWRSDIPAAWASHLCERSMSWEQRPTSSSVLTSSTTPWATVYAHISRTLYFFKNPSGKYDC